MVTARRAKYCSGFVDKAGIWNNGFFCPADSGTEEKHCCGDEYNRFCCPPQPRQLDAGSATCHHCMPIVVGVIVGATAMTSLALVICLLVPTCPLYKKRRQCRERQIRRAPSLVSQPGEHSRESLEMQRALRLVQTGQYQHFSITDVELSAVYPYFGEAPPPYTPSDGQPSPKLSSGHSSKVDITDRLHCGLPLSVIGGSKSCPGAPSGWMVNHLPSWRKGVLWTLQGMAEKTASLPTNTGEGVKGEISFNTL